MRGHAGPPSGVITMACAAALLHSHAVAGTPGQVEVRANAATLQQALDTLLRPQGVRYLVLNGSAARKDVAINRASLPEAVAALLYEYKADGAYLGTVVIANGSRARVPLRDAWKALLDTASPANAVTKQHLERVFLERWKAMAGGQALKPVKGRLTLVPFSYRDARIMGDLRAWLTQSQRLNAASLPDVSEAAQTLEGRIEVAHDWGELLGLARTEDRKDGTTVLYEAGSARPADLDAAQPADPWMTHWCPTALSGEGPILPRLRVDLQGSGTVGSLMAALSRSIPAAVSAEAALSALPATAWLPDVPLWAVLDAVSIASGWHWGPCDDAQEYSFRADEGMLGRLFRESGAEHRALTLLGEARAAPWVQSQTLRHLSQGHRDALLARTPVAIADLNGEARHWLRLGLRAQSESFMTEAAAALDSATSITVAEGMFTRWASGELRASVRLGPEQSLAFSLRGPDPGEEPIEGEVSAWGWGSPRLAWSTYWHQGGKQGPVGSRMGREMNAELVGDSLK